MCNILYYWDYFTKTHIKNIFSGSGNINIPANNTTVNKVNINFKNINNDKFTFTVTNNQINIIPKYNNKYIYLLYGDAYVSNTGTNQYPRLEVVWSGNILSTSSCNTLISAALVTTDGYLLNLFSSITNDGPTYINIYAIAQSAQDTIITIPNLVIKIIEQ